MICDGPPCPSASGLGPLDWVLAFNRAPFSTFLLNNSGPLRRTPISLRSDSLQSKVSKVQRFFPPQFSKFPFQPAQKTLIKLPLPALNPQFHDSVPSPSKGESPVFPLAIHFSAPFFFSLGNMFQT